MCVSVKYLSSSSSSCSLDQNQFNSWLIRQQIWERKSVKEYFDEFDRFIVASLYMPCQGHEAWKGNRQLKINLSFEAISQIQLWSFAMDQHMISSQSIF